MNIDPFDREGITNKLRALLYPEAELRAIINQGDQR